MTTPKAAQQYHDHEGVEVPVYPAEGYLREPGEEPQWVEMGHFSAYCGFIPGPVAVRMCLEAEMGLAVAEGLEIWVVEPREEPEEGLVE